MRDARPAAGFDAVAADYDRDFTGTRLGRALRERVHRRLMDAFAPGDHVVDLGCGTGEDAVWLARRGVRVTGVDASAAMLAVARDKAAAAGVAERVAFVQADLADGRLGLAPPEGGFDGALADFGAINCVEDRRVLAAALAAALRPGAPAVLVVMGPFCLWEVGFNALRGDLRTATRRWRRDVEGRVGSSASLPVWYPGPGRLRDDFRPWFRLRGLGAVGAFLPPTAMGAWFERHPRAAAALASADRRVEDRRWAARVADHYLAVFERR